MKYLTIILSLFSPICYSTDIASCSSPKGKSYVAEVGIVTKEDSGWQDDQISSGITKLVKLSEQNFDIQYVDTRQEIISASQDGGNVVLLNKGKNLISVLVVYPGKTAEVYTFLKNKSGNLEYIHTTSKGGDAVLTTRSSVMVGKCSYINFMNL